MAERTGIVAKYNHINRQGEIKPDGGGPSTSFYLPAVSNAEPLPKRGDKVSFEAPDPRKNKQGKLVQEKASSVTITERGPELPPERPREPRLRSRNGRKGEGRGRDRGREGGRGERRFPREGGEGRRDRGDSRDRNRRRGPRREGEGPAGLTVAGEETRPARPKRLRRRRPVEPTGKPKLAPGLQLSGTLPLSKDVNHRYLLSREVSPTLLLDKLIVWPRPIPAPKPKEGEPNLTAEGPRWRWIEKNLHYFFQKGVVPAISGSTRMRQPSKVLLARREELYRNYEHLGYKVERFGLKTTTRLISNLNRLSILARCGVLFEHLHSYPVLSGSALKGLAKRYSLQAGSGISDEMRAQIFGAKGSDGQVIFFDAFPVRRVTIDIESENCHYPDYYSDGLAPTDNSSPQLRASLAVGAGCDFRFTLALKPGGDSNLLTKSAALLNALLQNDGFGARTGVGFGKFAPLALHMVDALEGGSNELEGQSADSPQPDLG